MAAFKAAMRRWALSLILGAALPLASFGQPADPLELVTGPVQAATPASRETALKLLTRARRNFMLRSGDVAYRLKATFTMDSLGQTDYDGSWEMEDLFAPGLGLRWTAKAAAGYSTTRISLPAGTYAEGTASVIPLRLHEARGVLMDPLPSSSFADGESIRMSTTVFHGAAVTCVLLARSRNLAIPAAGRNWEESEECIDPKSGLLQVHSEAPGIYAVYDYSNAPQLGGRVLPRTVTVTEGGRTVSKISVESLEAIAPDASLFVPTAAMQAAGPAPAIASTTKLARIHAPAPLTPAMSLRSVCVFGVLTPAGQLVEAHSLQPSDPNSAAALADAKGIDFSPRSPAGAPPQQRLVFVIEKFASPN